jgi:mannose-6-phosphate isomerase-like protein (cupin superfamily)
MSSFRRRQIPEAHRQATTFKYVQPPSVERKSRHIVWLCRTDRMIAAVQVLTGHAGEFKLHSHAHLDGFWMVMQGRARFYGEGDALIADIGAYEGVLVPRGAKYWFENAGDDVLELLQVEAFDIALPTPQQLFADRTFHGPPDGTSDEDVSLSGTL